MNLAAMQLLGRYPGLAKLADLIDLKAKDIRVEHAQRIAEAFNVTIPFNEEIVEAFVALLRGKKYPRCRGLDSKSREYWRTGRLLPRRLQGSFGPKTFRSGGRLSARG